eukprot:evm.model.scf_130EXC.6 EVM.evm.TU.scf_130EXC.6   scf_130EXC:96728-106019(-)
MADGEGHELCPLCVEPLDATDRAIRYCACGYSMCLWCWHQIMETAGKDNQEGRCPNCRTPYEKDKVSMCDVDQEDRAPERACGSRAWRVKMICVSGARAGGDVPWAGWARVAGLCGGRRGGRVCSAWPMGATAGCRGPAPEPGPPELSEHRTRSGRGPDAPGGEMPRAWGGNRRLWPRRGMILRGWESGNRAGRGRGWLRAAARAVEDAPWDRAAARRSRLRRCWTLVGIEGVAEPVVGIELIMFGRARADSLLLLRSLGEEAMERVRGLGLGAMPQILALLSAGFGSFKWPTASMYAARSSAFSNLAAVSILQTLKRVEYFGQFGKIKKISVNRSSPYSTGQSRNGPTGAAYVTYHLDPDAANCIETIDGAVWDGRYVRACYGTTKYCAAFLKGVTCNNADCLYMHDIAVSDDTFTKEDMLSGFASGKPPFYHLIYFDRSKGPVPGSLAIKPPKGPAGSSSGSMSSRGQDLSPGGTSRGTNALSARSSGEGQDWPELNGRPSTLEAILREGGLRSRTPRDGTPREGARRDGTPRDRFSRNGTPREGTPRDGTPRDGTPRDGTPRDGTPRDGTPRFGEEGGRLVLPRRSNDGSWTHRSAGTPRSPMQGQSSSQSRPEAAPKKTLAVLSSPLKVKMVTRPPPHTKAPLTPTSRALGDGGKALERPSSRCSDPGRDNTVLGKDPRDGPADSTMGHSSSSNSRIYSKSPLRSRPSLEAAAPHSLQDQALPTRKSLTPRLSDLRDGGGKGGRRSPCPPELSMGLRPSGSRGRPNGQEDGRKSRGGGSREGTPRSDSLSGTPRSDSLPRTPGQEQTSAAVPLDEVWRLSGEEGVTGGVGRGFRPGLAKSGSFKGVSRRGPPPGFENSLARRNSSQSGATGQTEKDEEVPAAQADAQQTLQASQGVPALEQVSGTQQMGDSPLRASQVLKQNELDMNVQENRPRQDFASGASVPAVGMPADVPGSLPTGGVTDLSATQMQSLLLGLTSRPSSPSLLQLGAQQNQPGGISAHGIHLGLESHLRETDARQLAGHQTADGLRPPLQPNGVFQQQQQQQLQQPQPQQQQQVQSPLATAANPLLDLLRQLQLGPTARQKVPTDNGFHQPPQATMLSPLNDPAVLAVKKTSEKERQLGLGARGLQQNPNDFLSGQFPQTPFAMGDNAALLNNSGLLGLRASSQVERQLGWGQVNSQPAQVPQEFLGPYMAGNSGLMAHNAAQETMMLGMGATSDPLQLGLVPGLGLPPQLPLQMMEQNNAKFFASQGAPRGGSYGPL